MAIQDDFTVAANGNIRYVGADHGVTGAAYYTVIAFHRWLQDLADDAVAAAASSDFLDITDLTPSDRSTDNIITLINSYNIDDIAAEHLYDGTIIQTGGNEFYDGLVVIAAKGMDLQIIQNGKVLANDFWNTIPFGDTFKGLNRDEANGISHRFMLKTRTGAADIDGRRLVGITREWGQTFGEFKINGTSRGNNVLAFSYATDLNNATAVGTVAGYTDVTNLSVGYNGIDVNNDTTNEFYYSKWDKGSRSINQFYERMKWVSKRATAEALCADTGTAYNVGNGTITRQGQSFVVGANAMFLSEATFKLKKVGAPSGNITFTIYAHSGTFGTSSVGTGAALATSTTYAAAQLNTATYRAVKLGFATPFKMVAATNYVIAVEYTGDVSNYIQVEGAAAGTHGGNAASFAGTWTAAAAADLNFQAFSSADMYGIPGELFRGITHEITLSTGTGTWTTAGEVVTWSGGSGQRLAVNNLTGASATKMWIQLLTGVAPTTTQVITGATTAATGTASGAAVERSLSFPFVGVSTGSALIGSYGLGLEAADLSASDKVFDLTNTQITPPNYVTFTVSGLVSTEDYVLVGPESGGVLQLAQFTIATTALTTANVTAVIINTTIPSDTPTTGTIRVADNNGVFHRLIYTSRTGTTFTIDPTASEVDVPNVADFNVVNANIGNSVFISYIDKLASATTAAFTSVYSSNRALFIRVRDGKASPIKTFESTGTLASGGGSASAIRTTDA